MYILWLRWRSIRKNSLKDIRDRNYVHPDINGRYNRLKTCDRIRKVHSEWKWAKIWAKSIGKGLYKVFNEIVNELNNALPELVESSSEVSHCIPEPRNVQKSPNY